MHVVIFEGNHWRQFAPLSLSRPAFQLCCGVGTLLAKQIRATQPTKLTLWVRPGLEAYCRQFILPHLPCPADVNVPLDDEPVLLLSGRTLHLSHFEHEDMQSVVVDQTATGPIVRQAWVHDPGLAPTDLFDRTSRWMKILDLPQSMPQSRLPEFIWDLLSWNEEAIVTDSIARQEPSNPKPAGPYHMVEESNIWLGPSVKLSPGCVLDGSKGPVILANHVTIGANAVLQGPCYIGPHTQVSPLATIRQGVSIGPMCKIGGEVFNSIVLGYTNKPHDGFLGDSYIGEWVNLGAGACTSNLKNTYSQISMSLGGEQFETGRRFLGSMIGDHTKVAIGTQLMTGSYIGYNSMIATSQYPPKFVPSFTYLTDAGMEPYRLDKAESAMKEVFNRRYREWTATDELMNQFVMETAKSVEATAASKV
jgi:UDP-N-acetylglucosamine diphosphorylase / glucose-1-phosphate thymidylyltransferase / UDP-N-acetylgalactosamine diphosphorylase / glucosamine-1-phosphate N-acetyltransferase / galactosamine-1-phosphate N-acetyltransferase